MLPLDHPGRSAFAEAVADQEDWQTGTINWLADRRQQLREHYEAEERKASRGLRPRLQVELLYVVSWHHAEAPADEVLEAWGDAIRSTRPWPPIGHAKLDLSDSQLATLATISGKSRSYGADIAAPPPDASQPPIPGNRLLIDWASLRDSVGVTVVAQPAPEPNAEPAQLPLPEIGEDLVAKRAALRARQVALETKGRKFFKGSRKFIANRQEQDRIARQLTALDRQLLNAALDSSANAQPLGIGRTKQDLEIEKFGSDN